MVHTHVDIDAAAWTGVRLKLWAEQGSCVNPSNYGWINFALLAPCSLVLRPVFRLLVPGKRSEP